MSQTALYAPALGNPAGASAGMLRTFMCPGAITPASPIILSFGHPATDADLPRLAVIHHSQRGRVPVQNRTPNQPDSTDSAGPQSRDGK